MCIKKITSFFFLTLFFLVGFSAESYKINVGENTIIEFKAVRATENINNETTQLISQENNGAKYFLDEKNTFLISLN